MGAYFNNAATTWPKPDCVAEAMSNFLIHGGANLARGASSQRDINTLNFVLDCRLKLASLFGGYENSDPRYVTFCANITEAINIILHGFLKPEMRVITTSSEHNAVMRPLRFLEQRGVKLDILQCDLDSFLNPKNLLKALSEDKYDLMIMSHASNVCGTVQDLNKIAAICRDFNLPLVLDAAQTAGVININASKLNLAALCFTGHKGLMGPQGTGGIIWRPDFANKVTPIISGGTGSYSHLEYQPEDLPDKFESGTPNLPGIAGLNAALEWLEKTGIENIAAKERELGEYFLDKIKRLDGVIFNGKQDMNGRLSVFSLNFLNFNNFNNKDNKDKNNLIDNGILADELSRLGFETRPGLHCAPAAHKTLGTFQGGSLRVSFGYFNNFKEIDAFIEALIIIVDKLKN